MARRTGKRKRVQEQKPPAPTLRCAIYTRKSTSEGLEQELNSLDAQRIACENYIKSQKGVGWTALPDRYDDGGYTGGNMDRPALKRLLSDVESGLVDCVVVYKVDRLSRSLMDFVTIISVLDRRETSFVSVTQQFNTTTSMGRLTLNVLLSFAQFEREIIAERTRDKMAVVRRMGKWVGGIPVLGYDVDPQGGRIHVNEDEAAQVRAIFELYLMHQSLTATVQEVRDRGWTMKRWTTKKGREAGGGCINVVNLSRMLGNRTYLGQVEYRGEVIDGEHDAIVDVALWMKVQGILRRNASNGGKLVRNRYGALLRGVIRCGSCDAAMTHSISGPANRRRRYYVCCRAQKEGWDACPTKSVPAGEIEKFVVEQIRNIGKDSKIVLATLDKVNEEIGRQAKAVAKEQAAVARRVKRDTAEMNRLIRQTAKNGEGESPSNARLADLQDRIQAAEQRATDLNEESIALARQKVSEKDLASALSLFDPVWDSLTTLERTRIINLLVETVTYDREKGKINITFRPSGIRSLAQEETVTRGSAHNGA